MKRSKIFSAACDSRPIRHPRNKRQKERRLLRSFARRWGNRNVNLCDFAEGIERGFDPSLVADNDDPQLGWIDILVGDAGDIGGGDVLDAGFVLFEEVRGIAVEGERDLLVEESSRANRSGR